MKEQAAARQGHQVYVHVSRQQVEAAIAEWEALHGPVPKVPYDPRAEWRPSCDFHNYSAFESPIAVELGISGSPL